MSEKILISFLGRGDKNSGYDKRVYKFENSNIEFNNAADENDQLSFFGCALLKYNLDNSKEHYDKFIVIGTPDSRWKNLFEDNSLGITDDDGKKFIKSLNDFDNDNDIDDKTNCTEKERQELQDVLDRIAEHYNNQKSKKTEIFLKLINNGMSQDDFELFFKVMNAYINNGDKVTIDVTHGYKTMGIMGNAVVQYLKLVKNITIENIYYAWLKNDDKSSNDATIVIDLNMIKQINDWGNAFSQYEKSKDLSCFTELLKENDFSSKTIQDINKFSFDERVSNFRQPNDVLRKQSINVLNLFNENNAKLTPLLEVIKGTFEEKVKWLRKEEKWQRQLLCAESYLDCGDYLRAVIYTFEGGINLYIDYIKKKGYISDLFKDIESVLQPNSRYYKNQVFNIYKAWQCIAYLNVFPKDKKSIARLQRDILLPLKNDQSDKLDHYEKYFQEELKHIILKNNELFSNNLLNTFYNLKNIRNSIAHGSELQDEWLRKTLENENLLKNFLSSILEEFYKIGNLSL